MEVNGKARGGFQLQIIKVNTRVLKINTLDPVQKKEAETAQASPS